MGYWFIPKKWAPRITAFYREHLIPYTNYYRPCGFPSHETDDKGKRTTKYHCYMTPLQKLASINDVSQYLKSGITIASLKAEAAKKTPNQSAAEMNEAKRQLFKMIADDICGRM